MGRLFVTDLNSISDSVIGHSLTSDLGIAWGSPWPIYQGNIPFAVMSLTHKG